MSTSRRIVVACLLSALALAAGCEAGTIEGSDGGRRDVQSLDLVTGDSSAVEEDAMRPPVDVALDSPRDVPRDGPPPPPTDVVTDTGPRYCPTTCNTDLECQNMCPEPFTGYHYCCNYGTGGGTCSQRSMACDGTGMEAGTLGAACHSDSECNAGGANCCVTIGSAGTCGCMGSFGCQPAPLCS